MTVVLQLIGFSNLILTVGTSPFIVVSQNFLPPLLSTLPVYQELKIKSLTGINRIKTGQKDIFKSFRGEINF